ncbi:MAG: DNA alkylation repair protein [Lachnospiraceae bacterium]|nr:DNA alkylation repair protein [Lachnospiraceae bacterium]
MNEEWAKEAELSVRNQLFSMQDLSYRDFHSKLIPDIDPERIIGVRTPQLRKYAKGLAKTPEAAEYLQILPHRYYDENNLHGFLIEEIRDYGTCITELNRFLPYVDNWATCDLMAPKVLKKHLQELLDQIRIWIASDHTYTIRFGIGMLMRFYLDDAFDREYPELVAGVRSEEYYVRMMAAWYFATALAKQYDAVVPYLEEQRLEPWTHNKTIQKAVESYRITPEQKAYLRTLKIKSIS